MLPVIHDHDGHIDDLISLALLATAPEGKLHATTLSPGDCYLEPSIEAVEKLLTVLNITDIDFTFGTDEGIHPFPHNYRKDSNNLPHVAAFKGVEVINSICRKDITAPEYLAQTLSGEQKFNIVETGPLTNIADAIALNPDIKQNINGLWVMGGAIHVPGNVYEADAPGHDGSAEWNFFNHPVAAKAVLDSGIPITLICLDTTNDLLVTPEFVNRLSKNKEHFLSQFSSEAWEIVLANPAQAFDYYMWDISTVAALLQPDLFDFKEERIVIHTDGPSAGRTEANPNGHVVRVPKIKSKAAIEDYFVEALKV